MSNKRKKGNSRKSKTSTLRQHRQSGKTLSPALMSTAGETLQQVPWLRDTFPDMLWLCMLITEYGTAGMRLAAEVLDRIDEILDSQAGQGRPNNLVLTGQLTTFEQIPQIVRATVINSLQRDGMYEPAVPWTFARALMKYEDAPGMWLFDGWRGNEQIIGADEPQNLLARIVEDHSHGQGPATTRTKALFLRALFKADKIRLDPDIGKRWGSILPRYPDSINEDERSYIEPSIRAAFLAFANSQDAITKGHTSTTSLTWAQNFWRSNWKLYDCKTAATGASFQIDDGEREETTRAIREARENWRTQLSNLSDRLLEIARNSDPDLYAPDKHEVLTGITYRMIRSASVLIEYPGLWTMEHGSSYIRALVEARIVLKWLAKKDDADLYSRFKAYGRGRLKLLKLHLEEYRNSLEEQSEDLDAQIDYLTGLVNQDIWEEFQEISIEGSFAGVDTRKMANQVGMLTEYRLLFAPASAAVHGEWATLDQYALTVCRNPLHRQHRIPRDDLHTLLGPGLVDSLLGHATALVDDYETAIRGDADEGITSDCAQSSGVKDS